MQKILTIALFFIAVAASAQLKFTTQAPTEVDINGTFRVQYTINSTDVSDFIGPDFKDFNRHSGPFSSSFSNYQIINGKSSSSSSTTYTYILSAKSKGEFTIPGASISADGKTYHSNAVTVKVTGDANKRQPSQNRQSGQDEIQRSGSSVTNQDLYFTVTANKKKVYEQEPIVLTYKFHSRVGVGLSNVRLRQKPDLKGFLAQEVPLPKNLSPTTEEKNNQLYRVGTNLQYVLFPQQTGKLSIPELAFDCEVVQRNMNINMIDAFFNGAGHVSVQVQRKTPELQIEVQPLPSPRPANFSGGVGSFNVKGEMLTQAPLTHDICTYRITITGAGNMKLIKAPTLQFPKDFDVYDPKTTDETSLTAEGIAGSITFDYPFVPKNVGTYTLPSAEFVFFDSAKEEYVTLHTEPITLNIGQGKRSAKDVEEEMELRNSDIRPPHIPTAAADSRLEWGSPLYWALHLLLLLAAGTVYLAARKYVRANADVIGRRYKKAGKKATQQLKKAKQLLSAGNSAAFYAEVERAMRKYLEEKFSVSLLEQSKEQLTAELTDRNISAATVSAFVAIIEECEFARFAPSASEQQKEQLYEQALAAINSIENEVKQ